MATNIKKVAQYAQFSDDIQLDHLVKDFLCSNPILTNVQKSESTNQRTFAVAARLLKLFALRLHQTAPSWTAEIGAVERPYFLQNDAIPSPWFRELCFQKSSITKKENQFANWSNCPLTSSFKHAIIITVIKSNFFRKFDEKNHVETNRYNQPHESLRKTEFKSG